MQSPKLIDVVIKWNASIPFMLIKHAFETQLHTGNAATVTELNLNIHVQSPIFFGINFCVCFQVMK